MHTRSTPSLSICFTLFIASLVASSTGCVRLAANLVNAIKGNERPAEYDGFTEQKVAIVCLRDGALSADATSALFTRYVHVALNTNVKKIQLVRQDEVEQWLEAHDWNTSDLTEIGRGVKAEKLLVVDIAGMKLKEGATLYRGQCNVNVTVYDVKNKGAVVFEKQIPELTFPREGGPSMMDTTEAKFRNLFVTIIARKVSNLFYAVDPTADIALDATSNSF
jgi:hypothetical protein